MAKVNDDIRKAARDAGLRLWQVAAAIGMSDASFSRLLRRPLSPRIRKKVTDAINELAIHKICADASAEHEDSSQSPDPVEKAYALGVETMRSAALREIVKLEKTCAGTEKDALVSARYAIKTLKMFNG